MTTLKIYKLEDLEETEPVAILLEGEHLIGRGFLNVKPCTFFYCILTISSF